ncbi:hypothetical protein KAU11_08445 [Candidatus Babeliales bacterium]|nr:hypothetical protein [Candidatus Babeliales bacterium]
MTFPPMPPPPGGPSGQYIIAGKVQYHEVDVTGAKIWFENETHIGSGNLTSSEIDSNFAYDAANMSAFGNNDVILISVTHDGRRGQKRITVNTSNFGEDIGTIILQAHWGCCM